MTGPSDALALGFSDYSTAKTVFVVAAALLFLCVTAAYVRLQLHQRGRRAPAPVRLLNRISERTIDMIKRPLTAAVLDEVVSVLRTGHYATNVAAALDENHTALKRMITDKVLADPVAARSLARLPFSQRVVEEVADAGLRVLFDVLIDPRTDEVVADMLRENVEQIREDVVAAGAGS